MSSITYSRSRMNPVEIKKEEQTSTPALLAKSAKAGLGVSKESNLNKNTFEQTAQEWSTENLMYYSLLSAQGDLQSAINEYFKLRQTNAFDANLYLQAAQFFVNHHQLVSSP